MEKVVKNMLSFQLVSQFIVGGPFGVFSAITGISKQNVFTFVV